MKWTGYEEDIVQEYGVYISDWPNNIPFVNLSIASSGKPTLVKLLNFWQDGKTAWRTLTVPQKRERKRKLAAMRASGEKATPVPRKERSDKGKKRARKESDDDSEDEPEVGPSKRMTIV